MNVLSEKSIVEMDRIIRTTAPNDYDIGKMSYSTKWLWNQEDDYDDKHP